MPLYICEVWPASDDVRARELTPPGVNPDPAELLNNSVDSGFILVGIAL